MLGAVEPRCVDALVDGSRMPLEHILTEPPDQAGEITGRTHRAITRDEARRMCYYACPGALPPLTAAKAGIFGRALRAARQAGNANPWAHALRSVHGLGCYRGHVDYPDRWCDLWLKWSPRAVLCAEQRIGLRQSAGQAVVDCRAELCAEAPTVVGTIISTGPRWGLLGLLAAGGVLAYAYNRRG